MTNVHANTFLKPQSSAQRQYEALRARYVDGLSCKAAAEAFGYSLGSFRNLCSKFIAAPKFSCFDRSAESAPAVEPARAQHPLRNQRILELRTTEQLSVQHIAQKLKQEHLPASAATVAKVIRQAGLPRLKRRSGRELQDLIRPAAAAPADRQLFQLTRESFHSRFGGLFLFAPLLTELNLEQLLTELAMPGSKKIPTGCAWRTLLALKLWGIGRRPSQAMAEVFDPGLALFAGLNVFPKRSWLTDYSCRVDPRQLPLLTRNWNRAVYDCGIQRGHSLDLDFHTIPYHGERALIEKHYVSKRSRSQQGILAFLARDADARVFCFADAKVRKSDQNDQVLRFVEFFQQDTGRVPVELVFDSKLTTYANLAELERLNIAFLTLRRRSKNLLHDLKQRPAADWQRIQLSNVGRKYRTPKVIDQLVTLRHYHKPIRQLAIDDLGHDSPTLLLTNQVNAKPADLIDRYARRMVIENQIADTIGFFHMDALSAAVPMRIDTDLQLTLFASALYRIFANRIGNGHQKTTAKVLFRDFICATARITILDQSIQVRFNRRAHNPLLINAGFGDQAVPIPWLDNRLLQFVFD